MALIHWGEKERQAYNLLVEAAQLENAKIAGLKVTFDRSGIVTYEMRGIIKPPKESSLPSLDMGVQTVR